MSQTPGVTSVQNNTANALQIGNQQIPPEGPKAIPYNFNFVTAGSYLIDINFLYQQKIISVVQVFYCDNSLNGSPVQVQIQQTSQQVIVPPGAEGYFAVLCPNGGTMTVSSGGAVQVPFYLINVPISPTVWYPNSAGSPAFEFDGAGNLKVADQLLSPLITTIGASPGLDVNVISGGGGGGGSSSSIFYNASSSVNYGVEHSLAATAGHFWTIESVLMTISADAIAAAAGITSFLLKDTNGNFIVRRDILLPIAVPATATIYAPLVELSGLNWVLAAGVGLDFWQQGPQGLNGGECSLTVGAFLT